MFQIIAIFVAGMLTPARWQAIRKIGVLLAISSIPAVVALATRTFASDPDRRREPDVKRESMLLQSKPTSSAKIGLAVGLCAIQGRREEMEDTHVVHSAFSSERCFLAFCNSV